MSAPKFSIENALKLHLSYSQPAGAVHVFSGFAAALRDARRVTGRNPDNGAKVDPNWHGSWLGAIGYMALLDQIGSSFKPQQEPLSTQNNSISKALAYFSSPKLSQAEIDAIYALRCGFAHDYSLFNLNKATPSLQHRFTVVSDTSSPLVTLPKVPWDGDPNNKTHDNLTIINLEVLDDHVEFICQQILHLAKKNELEIVLPGGPDELVARYMFYRSS